MYIVFENSGQLVQETLKHHPKSDVTSFSHQQIHLSSIASSPFSHNLNIYRMTDPVDPEFLALPPRLRQRIDRAFDRGLPKLRSSGRKRRKLNNDGGVIPKDRDMVGEGGFMEGGDDHGGFIPDDGAGGGGDEGGYMLDDEGEGGFMPDDDVEGGFMPDDVNSPSVDSPRPSSSRRKSPTIAISTPLRSGKVPLSSIPKLLGLLNLPADEDVINVFKASATGWGAAEEEDSAMEGARRRGRGKGDEGEEKLGVERKDFRAVCAAIMDGGDEDEGGEGKMDIDEDIAAESEDDSDSGSEEDTFRLDEGSELSSLSSDSEYGASRKKTRAEASGSAKSKGKGKERDTGDITPAKKRRSKKSDLLEQKGPLKLVGRQREVVRDLWDMMKGINGEEQTETAKRPRKGEGSAYVLGREEVKKWVREMGEMWTEDEVGSFCSQRLRTCE